MKGFMFQTHCRPLSVDSQISVYFVVDVDSDWIHAKKIGRPKWSMSHRVRTIQSVPNISHCFVAAHTHHSNGSGEVVVDITSVSFTYILKRRPDKYRLLWFI